MHLNIPLIRYIDFVLASLDQPLTLIDVNAKCGDSMPGTVEGAL